MLSIISIKLDRNLLLELRYFKTVFIKRVPKLTYFFSSKYLMSISEWNFKELGDEGQIQGWRIFVMERVQIFRKHQRNSLLRTWKI
jgi:hypothetical protein